MVFFSVGVVLLGAIALFALASLRLGRDALELEMRELYGVVVRPGSGGERRK